MADTALCAAQVLWEEWKALARTKPSHEQGNIGSEQGKATGVDDKIIAPKPKVAVERNDSEPIAEVKTIEEMESPPDNITEIYRRLNRDNHWALCLSGGGIRSAAFALGVIQRFAAQRISPKVETDEAGSALQQFEYLSTVSGGGYIGSWLSAWLFQERQKRGPGGGGANQVVTDLNRRIMDRAEVSAISNLRRDSHYLAPSFSAISPDLWSDIAAITRNLCLNWLLLVPPMIFAVLITKAASYGFIDALSITGGSIGFWSVMIVTTIGFVAALSFSVASRPARGLINASQAQFLICDMAIFLISAALLVFVLGSHNGRIILSGAVDTFGFAWLNGVVSTIAVLSRGALLGLGSIWCHGSPRRCGN